MISFASLQKLFSKHKKTIYGGIALELFFFVMVTLLLLQYYEHTQPLNEDIQFLLENSGYTNQASLKELAEFQPEAESLHLALQAEFIRTLFSLLLSFHVIYGLFYALFFRKTIMMGKFIAINVVIQLFLWLIYSLVVEISSDQYALISQKSFVSTLVFLSIVFLSFFFSYLLLVSSEKGNIFVQFKKIIKKNLFSLFGVYFFIQLLTVLLFLFSLYLLVIVEGTVMLLLNIVFFLFLFLPFRVISRIYFLERVVFCRDEKTRRAKLR